jgi:glucose/arabinose dehydrogenase
MIRAALVIVIVVALATSSARAAEPVAARCGSDRPALQEIKTAEGLVIAPDGTIYFTQPYGAGASSYLGRYRPPYAKPELQWLDLGGKALGITIDPKLKMLYAGSRDRKKLLAIPLADAPEVRELADVEPKINGLTLGGDDAVYYTDQGGGHVYRVTAAGEKSRVTRTPLEDPNGLAFGPDGALYVLTYAKARVTRLRLQQGKEVAREPFAEVTGGKNADGIAFDVKGRLYVTAGSLFRISADGKTVTALGKLNGANAEFGVGPLACNDLYTSGNGQGIARYTADAQGMDVPWHRAKVRQKPVVPNPSPPPPVAEALGRKFKLDLVTRATTEAVGIIAVPGEKPGRLFVVEKRGPIRILRGHAFAPRPFLDLTGQVSLWNKPNSEQGLLGLVFHPHYQKNGRFYIDYTDLEGETRVVEYHVDPADPDHADPHPVREILTVHQPYNNHNGGDLKFGPDGKLYVGLGDGGNAGDPHHNAQNPRTLLGKMLRIDVDAATLTPTVIARGLRNPWRYTFDRRTGDLYIADVGQNVFEYVHYLPARQVGHQQDFGWNVFEGNHCFEAERCAAKGRTAPVIEYPHSEGCSITGGYVYRGKALPELAGTYFYSDFCTAILRGFRIKGGKAVDHHDWKPALDPEFQLAKVSAFGEDQDGELFVVTHEGPIFKLIRADPTTRAASLTPPR